MPDFSGNVDGIGKVEFYYDDADGRIDRIAQEDDWGEAVEQIERMILDLDSAVSRIRLSDGEERVAKIREYLGRQVEIVNRETGQIHEGVVLDIDDVNGGRDALLTVYAQDAETVKTRIAIEGYFLEENPLH